MKILIAGAGIGGLYSAYLLGKNGHDVTVYEKSENLDSMRYDWHDDINPHDFEKLGLTLPSESFPKKPWTFVSPCGSTITVEQSDEYLDYSTERRPLNSYLFGLATQYANIHFGITVNKALYENEKICGLVFSDGSFEKCDLVIDSCGVDSPIRKSLPDECGIEKNVNEDDIFVVYRAFYNAIPEAEVKFTNKAYMKHLGEKGISWFIMDNNPNLVNVLIGRLGGLNKETLEQAKKHLHDDNPAFGNDLKRGGIVCRIPVRNPLKVFVANGYASIGDSACMTIPMIGSGIITSLYAAKFLSDTLNKNSEPSAQNLWNYQIAVYKKFGAEHYGVNYMKNWLLAQDNHIIDWVFSSGVLSKKDMQLSSVGILINLSFSDVMQKLKKGFPYINRLLAMSNMLSKCHKLAKIALNIPKTYDKSKIDKWIKKLESII